MVETNTKLIVIVIINIGYQKKEKGEYSNAILFHKKTF